MSKSTFIFCDSCNPRGIRDENSNFLYNRRTSDCCSWYEFNEKKPLNIGWIVTSEGQNLCPKCQKRGLGTKANGQRHDSDKQLVRLVRHGRPCGFYIAKTSHFSATH